VAASVMQQSRPHALKTGGVGQSLAPVPKRNYRFAVGATDRDQCESPTLLVVSSSAFGASLSSSVNNNVSDGDSRFCTEPPRLEFGSWSSKGSKEAAKNIPFHIFMPRWQMAIVQACMVLTERVETLTRRQKEGIYNGGQGELLMDLALHLAAARYHVLKWAALLNVEGATAPRKPGRPTDSAEAIATLRSALPSLMVWASAVQKKLSALHNQCQDETGTVSEVRGLRVTVDELYSVVPHLEQMLYDANHLVNMGRFARSQTTPDLHDSKAKKPFPLSLKEPSLDKKETYRHVSSHKSSCDVQKQMHETFVQFV